VHGVLAGRYAPNLYSRFREVDRQWSFGYVCGRARSNRCPSSRNKRRNAIAAGAGILVRVAPELSVRQAISPHVLNSFFLY